MRVRIWLPPPVWWEAVGESGGRGCGAILVAPKGCQGAWQGLWGRLLLKTRQKVLGGVGALQGNTLGSGRAQRRGDRDAPLTGPWMTFTHVGLNPFLHHVALPTGKKWIPEF